ncbi:hypothetical protein SNL152K_10858 [Streptomyces sp. NL15-2K]|nr:hypothetical protein SNL152K_10858 [Streptomyces sp. NL15-2K]
MSTWGSVSQTRTEPHIAEQAQITTTDHATPSKIHVPGLSVRSFTR